MSAERARRPLAGMAWWMVAGAVAAGGAWGALRLGLAWPLWAGLAVGGALAGRGVSRSLGRPSGFGLPLLWAGVAVVGAAAVRIGGGVVGGGRWLGLADADWLGWLAAAGVAGLLAGAVSPRLSGLRATLGRSLSAGAAWGLGTLLGGWLALVAGYLLSSLADEGPLGPDRVWLQGVGWMVGGCVAGLVVTAVGGAWTHRVFVR